MSRTPRCQQLWEAVSWMTSPQTGKKLSDTERCKCCGKFRYRVMPTVKDSPRSHSWFKVGQRPTETPS